MWHSWYVKEPEFKPIHSSSRPQVLPSGSLYKVFFDMGLFLAFLFPCIGRRILNCATREVPQLLLIFELYSPKTCWDFNWNCIGSIDNLGEIWYIYSIEPSNPWTWLVSLHLFWFSLTSLKKILSFSPWRSHTFFIKFISIYLQPFMLL